MEDAGKQRQAQLFRALMHPARLALLEALREGEACVCHLEALLGQRQAYISQQLALLRTGGLITDRREGWNVYYAVAQPDVFVLLDTAYAMVGGGDPAPRLRPPANCPCPRCATIAEDAIRSQ
jgi:DNA-binding transcriptional ArsR family regulator